MDRVTFDALRAAWQPDADPRMLELILDGAIELAAADDIAPIVEHLQNTHVSEEIACKTARLYLEHRDPTMALTLLGDSTDERGIWRARALLALSRPQDAKHVYNEVVRSFPVLEDLDLVRSIEQAEPSADEGKTLNVVSIADHWEPKTAQREDAAANLPTSIFNSNAMQISFSDVGGLEEIKKQIRRKIITPFQKPSLFKRFQRKMGGGVLLYSPPGCGKTLLARATAGECDARFINIHIAEILDMYMGESEKRLSSVFAEARRETPSVLFFDEIEALAARRHYGSGDSKATLVSTFLSELDGFDASNEGVLVLAATNIPWAVDSAFRRPGRFERMQFVPPPDYEARLAILEILLRGKPGGESLHLKRLRRDPAGFQEPTCNIWWTAQPIWRSRKVWKAAARSR